MNKAVTKIEADAEVTDPLALLRVPFPAHHISKLPKPSKKQTEELMADFKKGARCGVCGGWHQSDVVHLDYVGHAALTDRLLDADPHWAWEPAGYTPEGLPKFDAVGGLWIKLTVAGVTRMGYGAADGKTGGDAVKEIIGDALRNAAMRFGAALDLWHKGDLHAPEEAEDSDAKGAEQMAIDLLRGSIDAAWFKEAWEKNFEGWKRVLDREAYARVLAVKNECVKKFVAEAEAKKTQALTPAPAEMPGDDEIPY